MEFRLARRSRSHFAFATLATLAAISLISACSADAPPGEPVVTTIQSFTATSLNATSPALITLGWNVQGLGGQLATCEITSDDPAMSPITIDSCRASESRNVSAATNDPSRTITYSLKVTSAIGVIDNATTTFTIGAGATESFDIALSGVDSLPAEVADAVTAAVSRWEQVIVSGFPDSSSYPAWCQNPVGYTMPSTIDDLLIHFEVVEMDGLNGTLASAGPDCILLEGERALTGIVSVDSADVDAMIEDGTLTNVLIHEIGHVLGLGTLWDTGSWGSRHLILGSGTDNPRLNGPATNAEWQRLGGLGETPLEATGSAGTRESHWRESTFETEVMTGWIDLTAPLSTVTAAGLADLGFNVDLAAADDYTLPGGTGGAGVLRPGGQTRQLIEDGRFAPPMRTPR
ncbi:MAG: hypothetical protein KDB26_12290 [Microthrixaceae bacterium]|nr:hypothetical protein [Microthrixaceae bacterium]